MIDAERLAEIRKRWTPMIMAALRDPKTGKIFTGESHAHIIDALEDGDNSIFLRVRKAYVYSRSFPESEHVGFTDGTEFLNRAQSQKKWGVFDSTDLRRIDAR